MSIFATTNETAKINMTTKDQVRACIAEHPGWKARDIAEYLGCNPAYVRATCYRYNWRIPTGRHIRKWTVNPEALPPRRRLTPVAGSMYELLAAIRSDPSCLSYHKEIDLIRTRIKS